MSRLRFVYPYTRTTTRSGRVVSYKISKKYFIFADTAIKLRTVARKFRSMVHLRSMYLKVSTLLEIILQNILVIPVESVCKFEVKRIKLIHLKSRDI